MEKWWFSSMLHNRLTEKFEIHICTKIKVVYCTLNSYIASISFFFFYTLFFFLSSFCITSSVRAMHVSLYSEVFDIDC